MNPSQQIAFDDAKKPVLAVGFTYPPEDTGADESRAAEALDALRYGLLVVLVDGHADGTRIRAVALARLLNLYESDAAAARKTGVNRSTLSRAVKRMRENIKNSLCNKVSAQNDCKH